MSLNLVTLLYLVASICFIQALKGLSHPTTSIKGNVFGMTGMAIAIIQIAFRPCAFRQQQPMRFQFQVEIPHAPAPDFLDDADTIHQMLGRDQMAIHFHGVIRADPQVPRRHAGGDGALHLDHPRLNPFEGHRIGQCHRDSPPPVPLRGRPGMVYEW